MIIRTFETMILEQSFSRTIFFDIRNSIPGQGEDSSIKAEGIKCTARLGSINSTYNTVVQQTAVIKEKILQIN